MTDKTVIPEDKAHDIAIKIDGWLQGVCGDSALCCNTWSDVEFYYGGRYGWKTKIRNAKKWGVLDIPGWLADEIYDDKDTVRDLIGDRIYDESTMAGFDDSESRIKIANAIIELGVHKALRLACEDFIRSAKGLKTRRHKVTKRVKRSKPDIVEVEPVAEVAKPVPPEPEKYDEYFFLIDGKVVDSEFLTKTQVEEESKHAGPGERWVLAKAHRAALNGDSNV